MGSGRRGDAEAQSYRMRLEDEARVAEVVGGAPGGGTGGRFRAEVPDCFGLLSIAGCAFLSVAPLRSFYHSCTLATAKRFACAVGLVSRRRFGGSEAGAAGRAGGRGGGVDPWLDTKGGFTGAPIDHLFGPPVGMSPVPGRAVYSQAESASDCGE